MTINECSNEAPYWGTIDPPAMIENYMDYSSDSCSNMFTMGQKTRMLSFLNTDRLPLLSSPACAALVGVGELSSFLKFELFPNPNDGMFQISYPEGGEEMRLYIFNGMGQMVFETTISTDAAIDISHLALGMYLVRGESGMNSSSKRLLITK